MCGPLHLCVCLVSFDYWGLICLPLKYTVLLLVTLSCLTLYLLVCINWDKALVPVRGSKSWALFSQSFPSQTPLNQPGMPWPQPVSFVSLSGLETRTYWPSSIISCSVLMANLGQWFLWSIMKTFVACSWRCHSKKVPLVLKKCIWQ